MKTKELMYLKFPEKINANSEKYISIRKAKLNCGSNQFETIKNLF